MRQETFSRDRATDIGAIRINNDAIASIASLAAMEVKGVYKMGGGIGRSLFEALFRKAPAKGVRIRAKDGDLKLTISIIVNYGVEIPRVADEVQESVKKAVERMTALVLAEVDVVVEGVHAQVI